MQSKISQKPLRTCKAETGTTRHSRDPARKRCVPVKPRFIMAKIIVAFLTPCKSQSSCIAVSV
ncbi:Uncharacterized protein APZ42_028103 [Daphnia magna]|uniref:Uncharacterized protein n=1 Tax=Daphnia magna TaxID=35525 RepID=A0A164QTC9_9CRUS|nr:Uncharacterized protein APZ42_028103 [Daphnia magna]